MPLANKTQMMLMNILMMTFAFSMKDEEDEDYEPRVEVRRILTNIPKFPDISAHQASEQKVVVLRLYGYRYRGPV